MKAAAAVLVLSAAAVIGAFREDAELWAEIDLLNGSRVEAVELEDLFRTAVEMAQSPELADQFEDLRTDAFSSDDFTEIENYAERAAPGIMVLIMGESNSIGVDPEYFLSLAEPGTQDYDFFDLAMDGFYVNGRPGTAELPVWMVRNGSSACAVNDPELSSIYAEIWQGMSLGFQGYYLAVAEETITALGGESGLSDSELQSYYQVYEDPYVIHLRIAFDSFLGGSGRGIARTGNCMDQLEKYEDYLPQRFVVLSIEAAAMGGYSVLIMSQECPDRIFDAWVYETAQGEKELRGFSESDMFTPEEVCEIAERYSEFLNDRRHSI